MVLKALRNAIFAKCAGSALDTLISGQLFYGKAPVGTRYPYVVFSSIHDSDDPTFTEDFTDYLIQFSAFSAESSSSNEIYDIRDAIKALYNEKSLTITGATLVWMYLVNAMGPMDDDSISQDGRDGGWACHLDFDVKIQT